MPAVLFGTAPSRLARYRYYVLWLIFGMGVSVVVAMWSSRWMVREEGLGRVSGRWLAEYRRDRDS